MHLGYYIHLHGKGHAQRAKAIAQYFKFPLTFIGTGVSRHDWSGVKYYQTLNLPPDKLEYVPNLPINEDCLTYSFHYAPFYSDSYRRRATKIADWVEKTKPVAVIVDVSAEFSQYFRLLGVPVIAVRQHGDRSDYPHLAGYDAAYKLFAPYPEILEFGSVPSWIREKTIYSPGFSRYSGRVLTRDVARKQLNLTPEQKVVLVLNGKGGTSHSLTKIAAAAVATPEWQWLVVGKTGRDRHSLPSNVTVVGWCKDTYPYLKAADVAIASGGHNTVMEIGTAEVPFLCIPEPRPFDEQQIKAQILQKLGLCVQLKHFPKENAIAEILERSQSIDTSKWRQIMAVDGAKQAANSIFAELKILSGYQQAANKINSLHLSEANYNDSEWQGVNQGIYKVSS